MYYCIFGCLDKFDYLCAVFYTGNMAHSKEPSRETYVSRIVDAAMHVVGTCSEKIITPRERKMIQLYLDGTPMSEIGVKYNISDERVRVLLIRSANKMSGMEENIFDKYLQALRRIEDLEAEVKKLRYTKEKIKARAEITTKEGVYLKDCQLSNRLLMPLHNRYPNITTVQELSTLTRKQILDIKGLSYGRLREVQDLLALFGYTLRQETDYDKK